MGPFVRSARGWHGTRLQRVGQPAEAGVSLGCSGSRTILLTVRLRTRIAPTPSGYLHLGNLVHFRLVSMWARVKNLDIQLRIDDVDSDRVRDDYVLDIFRCLDFLEISPQGGPTTLADCQPKDAGFRQYLREELRQAHERGLETYVCACSRQQLRAGESCSCKTANIAWKPGENSVRFADVVLWRRDDLPSTQLASLILDRDDGITHIMRGADLAPTTSLQRTIAPYFAARDFMAADFVHHGLVRAPDGRKLSKSAGSQATPLPLTPNLRDHIQSESLRLWWELGITP
jgi:glutamyl/glutaminyl-tRNA synthetase